MCSAHRYQPRIEAYHVVATSQAKALNFRPHVTNKMSRSYHSEIDHEQDYGPERSVTDRDFDENDYVEGVERRGLLWTFVACPDEEEFSHDQVAHDDAIIIAVDGACRNNGRPYAEASIGIFVHRDNYWNEASKLEDDDQVATNQRAELSAGLRALKIATSIRQRNSIPRYRPPGPYRMLRRVVIKSDSAYLVKGMTEWIYGWRNNGYINSRGSAVCNSDLFKQLEEAVDDLNDMDVQVQFWHVRRADNEVADCLANAALNDKSVEDALDEYFDE